MRKRTAKPRRNAGSKAMLFKEIATKFDGEWVILADPVVDEKNRVKSGRVVAHSPDRDEVYRKVLQMKPKPRSIASLCLVKSRENEEFML